MRELICRCEVLLEEAKVMELTYYLLSQKAESLFSCEATEGMVYGVSVVADCPGEGGFYTYAAEPGLSYLRNEALDFIYEIADAKVTPAGFLAIVDEYVSIF